MAYIGNGVGRSQIVAGQIAPSAVGYDELNVAELSGTIAGYKNRIINPKATIRQRVVVASTGSAYGPDRWQLGLNGIAASLHAANDTSTSFNGDSHLYLQCTTAKTSLAATDHAYVIQKVEGSNMADFMMGTAEAKTFTLSFSAICAVAFTMSVSFRNEASNRSYVSSVNIGPTKKRYSITVPGDVTGTWSSGTSTGLVVGFCGSSGSTYTTASVNQWVAGNYIAASSQSNLHAVVNQYINISDVQLEVGSAMTEFENRPASVELMLCQRYYCKSYNLWDAAGTNATSSALFAMQPSAAMWFKIGDVTFPVTMRAVPTFTVYGGTSGVAGKISYTGNPDADANVPSCSQRAAVIRTSGGGSAADACAHWTANAEL